MWVVLCDPYDHAALWAYSCLRRCGLDPLDLITPQELVCAKRSVHHIDERGARFEIQLSDGRTLISTGIRGALNRLSYVPTECLTAASETDRDYAIAETGALIVSWLACIDSVTVNMATACGLCGAWRPAMEWQLLAARAGIPIAPQSVSTRTAIESAPLATTHSALVFGEDTFGAHLPTSLASACARLARLAGADLLGVELHLDDRGEFHFVSATTFPDLRVGGDAFIEALHAKFTTSQTASA